MASKKQQKGTVEAASLPAPAPEAAYQLELQQAREQLTAKQQAFAEHFVACLNGTEAARAAKYEGDDNTLSSVAYENLRKPEIAHYLALLGSQGNVEAARAELVLRYWMLARATLEDFLRVEAPDEGQPHRHQGTLHLLQAKQRGVLGALRTFQQTTTTRRTRSGDEITETKTKIQLHDPYKAMAALSRLLGLTDGEDLGDGTLPPSERALMLVAKKMQIVFGGHG